MDILREVLDGSVQNCQNFRKTPTAVARRVKVKSNRLCFKCLKGRQGTALVCKIFSGLYHSLVCLLEKGEKKVLSAEQDDDQDQDDGGPQVYILQMVHKFCYIRCGNIFRLVLRHSPIRTVFLCKMTVERVIFQKNQQNWGSKLHL